MSEPTTTDELPDDVVATIGVPQYEEAGDFPVERGYIWTSASSVENGNPLFWSDAVAAAVTDGPVAPPTMLSVWFRPHHWAPGRTEQKLPLQIHFDLKERLDLPEAIMTENTIAFYEPVRPGDLLRTHQILRSVSTIKTTKLGTGRFWVIEVVYTNQRDDLVGIESYTGFGYKRPSQHTPTGAGAAAAGGGSSRSTTRSEASMVDGAPPTGPAAAQAAISRPSTAGDPNAPSTTPVPADADGGVGSTTPAPDAPAAGAATGAGAAAGGGGSSRSTTRSEASMVDGAPPTGPAAAQAPLARRQLDEISIGDVLPTLEYEVTATTVVLGALASRDWRPMHHDYRFATERNGVRDIFLNTPNQAAWFERSITDWTGPKGRLGQMTFRMKGSVFPGDTMRLDATVTKVSTDEVESGWVDLDVAMTVDGDVKTTCAARVAVPVSAEDNPWARRGDAWRPEPSG